MGMARSRRTKPLMLGIKSSPHRFASLLVLVVCCTGFPAQAQSIIERFEQFDRNDDGRITAKELPRPELFSRFDRNGDGGIEKSELPGNSPAPPTRSPGTGDLVMPQEPPHTAHLDLRYDEIEGVDPILLSLDLYVPEGEAKNLPVMIMIHGGGWRRGDKANPSIVGAKMHHFVAAGYIYASINYRLSPLEEGAGGLKHPIHAHDCARAIAWIHDHVSDYGGDPDQLHLMGHSAGGHLAALMATNGRFLKEAGKELSIVKTNVLLDPAAIDIPGYLDSVDGGGKTRLYANAFGTDRENQLDASPQQHIMPDQGIPPTLLFYQNGRVQGPVFTDALTEAGSPSKAVDTVTLDHGQINSHIGMLDEPMTELIMRLHAGEDASQFPAVLGKENLAADLPVASAVQYTRDYVAGSRDASGNFLGGTETMHLVAHEGKLFAGNGYWTDQPGDDPRPGAQILRKDGPDAEWQQDRNFPGAVRINAMKSVTFTLDALGEELEAPVSLLIADAGLARSRSSGPLLCFVRNDRSGEWGESRITSEADRAYIRVFGFHRDVKTGLEHVFAGTGAGEIYRGNHDPEAPGKIRWDSTPEYTNPDFNDSPYTRCQGFTVANGKVYASVSPRLLERVDGQQPEWVEVFCWNPEERAGAGLRGITAIPSPNGDHEVILGSREQEGRILRIDPMNGYSATDELNSRDFMNEALGNFRGGKLVAYNRFIPGTHPATGAPIHWLSVAGVKADDRRAAWLLVRHADATYEPVRVFDPELNPHPLLVSTRTLEFAPWNDREFYIGGYDGAANDRKNHNTAWLFRGLLSGDSPTADN